MLDLAGDAKLEYRLDVQLIVESSSTAQAPQFQDASGLPCRICLGKICWEQLRPLISRQQSESENLHEGAAAYFVANHDSAVLCALLALS